MSGLRYPYRNYALQASVPGSKSGAGKAYSATNSNTRISAPKPFVLPHPAGKQEALAAGAKAATQGVNLGLNSVRQRHNLVDRLQQLGIDDSRVLAAMRTVERHLFVDQGLASRAYENDALPIGYGQTISQPWVVAYMLQAMAKDRVPQRVLEIGAGCGYQAAVLAQFVPNVYAIERIRGLYEQAKLNLAQIKSPGHIRLIFGDGISGLAKYGPYDGIVVAAAGVKIPDVWLEQLSVGGRLLAPLGSSQQKLIMIERTGPDSWQRSELEDVRFVPLRPGTQL